MSLKSLFEKGAKNYKVVSLKSMNQILLDDVESVGYIEEFIKDRAKFKPHVDYLTASNFAIYGSLREYYDAGIKRIQQQYPYDGSLREKLKFFNDSSGFDEFLFENLYPRTNGYIQLSSQGWGTVTSTSGAYGNPQTKEYIYVKGGPNVGNVYNTASYQASNLEINGVSGNTVEFWLKKSSYESSKTQREVIFDVHTTGVLGNNHKYGRLTLELDSSDSNATPFLLTYQSGTTGVSSLRVGTNHLYASASDDTWHHYAFSVKNHSGSLMVQSYVDGIRNKVQLTGSTVGSLNTPLVAAVGSLVSNKVDKGEIVATNPGRGYGKLSGYLDEFRYWKISRNSKQIGRFYDTSIGAGSNKDPSNSPLGIYYKFNEGKTGQTSIDKNVLDYSGRISNGLWVGYSGNGRTNNSAIVESSASVSEFKDPILYPEHPDVKRFTDNYLESGYAYDLENNSSLFYTMPAWIVDEDGEEGDLRKVTQIMGSYFDSLHLQIKELTEINKIKLQDIDYKPHPFNNVKLESMGLVTPELFLDSSNINVFMNRDETEQFKNDLADVKNFIYNNIHNNIQSIYKSKGTERSFRNLFRCFGIDNDLIKIKTYSTDTEYPIETSYEPASSKVKYVNFNNDGNKDASVYQDIAGLSSDLREVDCRGYITGSAISDSSTLISDEDAANIGFTTEAQVFFPTRYKIQHKFFFETPQSSSLFGCYSVRKSAAGKNGTDTDWTRESDDDANFQVFAVKDKKNSRTAKFVLKCRNNLFEPIETPYYKDLYDGERWNLSVRMFPEFGESSQMSGSTNNINIAFYGATSVSDQIADRFYLTKSVTATVAKNFAKTSKRFYIGSNRRDFTGNLLNMSDVKITNFRHWMTHLTNDELDAHTIDLSNYGVDTPSRPMFSMVDVGNAQIPKINLLAINWNFSNLTGSNTDGEMYIFDTSSGSIDSDVRFGKISEIVGRIHPGKGINFASSTTSSIDVEFESTGRLESFESVRSQDMVKILNQDDETFTRDTRPTQYYFSFEKSMYDIISDEMLSFFAGISEFSNLIGNPTERYRPNYKKMEKLREIFFSRVENNPDIERYMEYYKWLDSSLSIMIDQLVPASVDASKDIRNVIQSHILERSKYFNKFPTLEMKTSDPEGQIRGVNELLYDWQHGHAPLPLSASQNCLWRRERAQRRTDLYVTSSGNEDTVLAVDKDREIIRRVSVTSVSGSTYATRRLSRPYRLSVEDQRHLKGGDNSFGNKKKRFFTGVSTAHGLSHMAVTGSDASPDNCEDVINPSKKRKIYAAADIAFTHKDRDINDVAPFTLYSSSVDAPTGYKSELYDNFKRGVDITNLHSDEYGDDREVTLQSPFTERWVGGNQHRHQDLSGSLYAPIEAKKDGRSRLEAFKILAKGGKLYVLPPNATGIDDSNLPIIDPDIQHAQMLREDLAKRPVNIRNIATIADTTTQSGSISIGNYNHIYDVVQYTTEDQRKDFLIDNLEQMTSSVSAIPGVKEFSKFYRPPRKSVFKARFASPGGTEVAGDSRGGHSIDRETNQYSVYNSMNYRNLSVRGPLDYLSKIPQTASTDSNSLVTNHKVNANPRYRRKLDGGSYNGEVDLNQDNVFVRHPIPQNDYQYAWITASLVTGRDPAEIAGHLHSFTQASVGDNTGSLRYERTYEFLTASSRIGTTVVDFAGLNTYVVDDISTTNNLTSRSEYYNLTGTIHHRQGPYGWPSWKQIRSGQSQMGRYLARNNIYALPMADSPLASFRPAVKATSGGSYEWPNNIAFGKRHFVSRTVSDQNFRFVDPPVSSNRHPFEIYGEMRNQVSIGTVSEQPMIYREKRTYSNTHARFANDSLTNIMGLRPSEEYLKNSLSEKDNAQQQEPLTMTVSDALEASENTYVHYSQEIFPREKYAYLKSTRQRSNFDTSGFWVKGPARIKTNSENSQGNIIPKLSSWPLDGTQNFKTTAINTTTTALGSSGQGELFADYSVFHNNQNFPSASAIYARPFPMQQKTSLPIVEYYELSLFHNWSGLNTFEQTEVEIPRTDSTYVYQIHNQLNLTSSYSDPGRLTSGIPTGLKNNEAEDSSTVSPTGPQVLQPDSGASYLAFYGNTINASEDSTLPGKDNIRSFASTSDAQKYYFYYETTNPIPDTPLYIEFYQRTSAFTTSDDWNMLIDGSPFPFYVQLKGDNQTSYKTIYKEELPRYSSDDTWHKVTIKVTSSYGDNQYLRFVKPVRNASYASDRSRTGITNLSIYTASLKQRQSHYSRQDQQLYVDTMTTTASNNFSFEYKTLYDIDSLGTAMLTSTSSVDPYYSLRNFNVFSDNRWDSLLDNSGATLSHENRTYTFKILPTATSAGKSNKVYIKNEKRDHSLFGVQNFRIPEDSGRDPFNFENYDDWSRQSRLLAKDFSIIPEFRMSEHMNHYIKEVGGSDPFYNCNSELFSLTGSTGPENSGQSNFYETYSHTDFIKYFNVVSDELSAENDMSPARLTLECKAFKKFLPYKGFYPADRMVELASEFSSSYSQYVTGGLWRNVLSPYYAPGIGFNSIKSGIAVDYPVIEPHKDRMYNKYGVMFQSASLAVDETAYAGDAVLPKVGSSGHYPTIAGESTSTPALSKNRIEIGGGSDWAKVLTGSLSNGETVMGTSFWIYLPMGTNQYSQPLSSYAPGHFRQSGVVLSLGGFDRVGDRKKHAKSGLHIGYTSRYNNSWTVYPPSNSIISSNRSSIVNFYVAGGTGTSFFVNATNFTTTTNLYRHGWNHVYVQVDLSSPTSANTDIYVNGVSATVENVDNFRGYDVVLDGQRNSYIGNNLEVVNFHNGTSKTAVDENNLTQENYLTRTNLDGTGVASFRILDADNISTTSRIEIETRSGTSITASATTTTTTTTDTNTPTFAIEDGLGSKLSNNAIATNIETCLDANSKLDCTKFEANSQLGDTTFVVVNMTTDGANGTVAPRAEVANAASGIDVSEAGFAIGDLIKPSECMITEMVVLNKEITAAEIKKLSGFKTAPSLQLPSNENYDISFNRAKGVFRGPVNPYLCLESDNRSAIVAWYKIGNDTGWTSRQSHVTNGQIVFNHAQNMMSGDIISPNSGAIDHYDVNRNPVPLNFLSGNFYGFSEWTGSVTNDLKFSENLRQRWNGIVDISNPAQYTLQYHKPGSYKYKTWFNFSKTNTPWFDRRSPTSKYVEKDILKDTLLLAELSGTLTMATGSTGVPSFIIGSRQNYTDDSTIPRIGSASYGTFHYIQSGAPEDDTVTSWGWGDETAASGSGIKNLTRIPFEAIVRPSVFTPDMKGTEDDEDDVAVFYEVEPHPSASLLSAFNLRMKYTGQNSQDNQTFDWNDEAYADEFKNDRNFCLGVAKDSDSLKAELDLDNARSEKHIYDYAAENFYAEAMNFFLKSKEGVTIRSSDTLQSPIDYNKTYKMIISLNSGVQPRKRFPMYDNPFAFGIPFDSVKFRPRDPNGNFMNRTDEHRSYGFAPYTPPHYDGRARAIYTFTPDRNRQYNSVTEVMEDTTVTFDRLVESYGSSRFTINTKDDYAYNHKYAMNLSESYNGFNKDSEYSYVTSYDENGNILEDRRSIVIQPKFECPNFNFTDSTADRPRTDKDKQILNRIRGVWHQTGSYTSDRVPNIAISSGKLTAGTQDLSKLLGMYIDNPLGGKLGRLPDRKVVKEAVVAIPFIRSNNVRKYFYLPPNEVYQAVRELGYPNYKLKTEQEKREFQEFKEFINETESDQELRFPRRSVLEMVKSMLNYNIPPQFNFLKYNDESGDYIRPFVMYLFEFGMELSQNDLALIWQNTTPDIGLDFHGRTEDNLVIESSVVSHELFTPNDILSEVNGVDIGPGGATEYRVTGYKDGIEGELQWMVFKVKQKGESSYFRKKELDKLPDGHPEKVVSVENDIYRYGFNWPYDYFSIVELVNIKATTRFNKVRTSNGIGLSSRSANMLHYRKGDRDS